MYTSKEEIIAAVRGNSRVVVWLTEKASFTHIPFNDIIIWWGSAEKAIDQAKQAVAALGLPADDILLVEGVSGMAALNPEWDGSDTFFCQDSNCKVAHSADQLLADRLFETAPPAVKWYEFGLRACEAGDYQEAVRAFREAVGLKPDFSANAWERLGYASHKLGQIDNAVMAYREAIRLKPDFRTAWYNLGVAYTRQGNHPQMMEAYEKLKVLDNEVAYEFFRECVLPRQKLL